MTSRNPVLVVVLFLSAVCVAQQDADVLRVSSQNVVLDIGVEDKAGRPISGLTSDDFEVVEDGVAQQIQYFRPPSATTAAEPIRGRAVIVLDELNTSTTDLAHAETSIEKLMSGLHEFPEPTALMLLSEKGLRPISEYTRDPSSVLSAIHRHRSEIHATLRDNLMWSNWRIKITFGALEQLARGNMGSGESQTILWISPGIQMDPDNFYSSAIDDLHRQIGRISNDLRRSRTTMDTVDPSGVGYGQVGPIGSVNALGGNAADAALANAYVALAMNDPKGSMNVALETFAADTGGRYFAGRNDVDAEMTAALQQAASTYVISYSPSNHDFNGKYRKIVVRVSRHELVVRTRPGYYAVAADGKMDDSAVKYELQHAISSGVAYTGIGMTLVCGTPLSGNLPLTIQFDPRTVQWATAEDGNLQAKLSLVAVLMDEKGRALQSATFHLNGTIGSKDFAAVMQKPWAQKVAVPLVPNVKALRVVVRDYASNRIGSADVSVTP